MDEKHDENWLLSKGWKKINGWKIDHEMLESDYEVSFWEDISDVVKKTTYYQSPHSDEWANDDLDDCIEQEENQAEVELASDVEYNDPI